jgi:phosphoenolpyruvate carboxylase
LPSSTSPGKRAPACREIVFRTPAFLKYFRTATPEAELGNLNIGSRPTRRKAADAGIGSLRAIPWIFAWTQTRHILPSWLGVGEALDKMLGSKATELRDMMEEWPFFNSTMSLIEMTLAKADMNIARAYDEVLVTDPEARANAFLHRVSTQPAPQPAASGARTFVGVRWPLRTCLFR